MARKSTSTTPKPKTRAAKKTKPVLRQPRRTQPEKIEPAAKKPIFGVATWITVIIFAALIGLAVYLNQRAATPDAEATPSAAVTYVFTSEDGLPNSIEVKPLDGEPVRLARNEENAWMLELPEKAEADQGLAEAAATQISSLRILDGIDLAPDILGLEDPAYVITIKFTGGSEHVLEVGDKTPTNNGYYVRVDNEKTVIVALSGIESLLNLASSPPYLNTPTPTAIPPTETPLPPTGTNTPKVVVTPTP
jgi:hypothetical protein